MPLRYFALWSIAIAIPVSGLYFVVGYYSGTAYSRTVRNLNYGGLVLLAIFVLAVVIYYLGKRWSEHWAEKI
jgi:membrane protein DedA with SNARE-associated domain